MAKGDVYADMQSVANGATYDIQPSAGQEVVLRNIGWSVGSTNTVKAEIYRKDGTGARQMLDEKSAPQLTYQYSYLPGPWHLTNSDYIQVKNVSGVTGYFWWDGIETKAA